ncbi:MAG TPA: hypothetical protein VIZ29_09645 [Gaiellaceae bacterium]
MDWQVTPEPADEAEREALVQAADEALDGDGDRPSAWWSSGLDDLGGFGVIPLVAGVRWSFRGKDAGSARIE